MFYSKTDENSELSKFSTILNSYLNGEVKFELIVKEVLSEAIGLAKGDKQSFEIQSKFFSTAVFLNHCCIELLKGLEVDTMSKENLQAVADIFAVRSTYFDTSSV
jgi:hypothetical protein